MPIIPKGGVNIKACYYFSHDSNAKDDPKCVLLIEQLGLEGYGIYWVLIETLRDQPDYKYPIALIPALARRYNTTAEKMRTVVNQYGLFMVDEHDFFSLSLIERMKIIDYKRELASIAGKRSAEKRLLLTSNQPPFNRGSTVDEQRKESKRNENKRNSNSMVPAVPPTLCPHQEIIKLYHKILPMMPQIKSWTDKRQSMLRTRWNEKQDHQSLEWWESFFTGISKMDFLCGQVPGKNGQAPFLADLEWIIRPTNFVKIIEGKYANRSSNSQTETPEERWAREYDRKHGNKAD